VGALALVSEMIHVTPFFGFALDPGHPGRFDHPTCGAFVDQRNVCPDRAASRHHGQSRNRGSSYVVRDGNNFAVAYVYFESEPGRHAAANLMTKDEARKIANGIAKLPELLELLKRPQDSPTPFEAKPQRHHKRQ
jgi:hypothetical protein